MAMSVHHPTSPKMSVIKRYLLPVRPFRYCLIANNNQETQVSSTSEIMRSQRRAAEAENCCNTWIDG